MKKKIMLLTMGIILIMDSCGNLARQHDSKNETAITNTEDNSEITDETEYLNNIDEYVDNVRANSENMTIVKDDDSKEKMVYFINKADTVKISIISDSNNTDIYFKDSNPIFISRNIVYDVDSSYMETAYFKKDSIYKCYKDGIENDDAEYIDHFESIVAGK